MDALRPFLRKWARRPMPAGILSKIFIPYALNSQIIPFFVCVFNNIKQIIKEIFVKSYFFTRRGPAKSDRTAEAALSGVYAQL